MTSRIVFMLGRRGRGGGANFSVWGDDDAENGESREESLALN